MATLSQLPSAVDLAFVAGDTFRIRVRIVNPDGSPIELNPDGDAIYGEANEHNFVAQIAQSTDRAIVASFEISPDPNDVKNAVILSLSPAETEMLLGAPGSEFNGIWDLQVSFPNGDVRTVAKGTVRVVDDISSLGRATGATAGKPGKWLPAGAVAPTSVSQLQSASPAITPTPTTAWTSGQWIQTDAQGSAGEAHWSGSAWVTGRKP